MNRLDRYILTQLLGPFGFFALTFAGIIWLTQALGLIDRVIASNQSALVFLEFSTLILPKVLTMILPFAAFGAGVFLVHRLYLESELVVIMAAGRSNFRMLLPYLAFGLLIGGLMFPLTMYLVPVSTTRLAERLAGFRNEITNSFISEGEFVHPADQVTIFVKDTSRTGEMEGLFLHDQRDVENPTTYSAQKALLLSDEEIIRLVMFDGIVLSSAAKGDSFSAVQFDQFTFDLSDLVEERAARRKAPREYFLPALLAPTEAMLASRRAVLGDFIAEGHSQVAVPLLAMLFPALAMACVLAGPFRRGSMGLKITLSVVVAALIQIAAQVAKEFVRDNPGMAVVAYLPALFTATLTCYLLYRAGSVRARPSRKSSLA